MEHNTITIELFARLKQLLVDNYLQLSNNEINFFINAILRKNSKVTKSIF